MRYQGGNLEVFVDATFASIAAGTAVPVLSRPAVVRQPGKLPGTIVFGRCHERCSRAGDPHSSASAS
jgi:hypothetical protein